MAFNFTARRRTLLLLMQGRTDLALMIEHHRALRIALLCLALGLTAVIYYPGLSGGFVFDDFPNIVNNARLHLHELTWSSLQAAAFSSRAGILRRPVSMITFALNEYFFGTGPFSFKVVNLLIHLANGAGLFLFGNLLLDAYRQTRKPGLAPHEIFWISLAAATAWLVHPLNFTGVLYVVQRMTSLSTLFTIAGLCCYLRGRERRWNGKGGIGLMVTGTAVFGTLALLSKESGALLPLYMFVVELAIFRLRKREGAIDRAVLAFFLLFLALPAAAGLAWMAHDPAVFFGGYVFRTFTPLERVLTEARVIIFYLRLVFAPTLNQLGLYHDDIAVSHGLLQPPQTLASLILILALLATAVLVRRRAPLVTLGILWFFTGQVLESTILPLEIAFEHRNYLADYGMLLPVCAAMLDSSRSATTLALRRSGLVLLIGMLSVITWMRAENWDSPYMEAVTEAWFHPDSAQSQYDAGRIYADLALAGQARYAPLAYRHLEHSASLDHNSIMADAGLIIFAGKDHSRIDPQWVSAIERRIAHAPITPSNVTSMRQLQICQEGPCRVSNRSMTALFSAAFHNPLLYRTTQQYADIVTIYGSFLINHLHDPQDGRIAFEKAVHIDPGQLQYQINLTRLLVAMGRYRDAHRHLAVMTRSDTLGSYGPEVGSLRQELAALPDRNLPFPVRRTPVPAARLLTILKG